MERNCMEQKQDVMMFFEGHREVFPIYEAFETRLLQQYPESRIKVQKTQISFSNRHLYACVSFLRPKRKSELPAAYFVLTLGLPYSLESERVAVKTEPYPGRWTTHLVIHMLSDLDQELFEWVRQAYEFAAHK